MKLWDTKSIFKKQDKKKKFRTIKSLITRKAHESDINSIAVSPNDQLIASASQDKLIKLWDSKELQLLNTFKGHKRGIWSIEFSTIDKCLVSSSSDKTIKIWSLNDYSCLKTFEGHTGSVLKVSFISKGMQLISTGSDGLVKLWTIKTNECVNTFEKHEDKIWALACKDDGDCIVTGGADSLLSIWNDKTELIHQEKEKEKETILLKQQELSNLLLSKEYRKAIAIAFELDQPYRILSIFKQLLFDSEEPAESKAIISDVIMNFDDKTLSKCLFYIRDWNTAISNVLLSQQILFFIFQSFPPAKLLKLPSFKQVCTLSCSCSLTSFIFILNSMPFLKWKRYCKDYSHTRKDTSKEWINYSKNHASLILH